MSHKSDTYNTHIKVQYSSKTQQHIRTIIKNNNDLKYNPKNSKEIKKLEAEILNAEFS